MATTTDLLTDLQSAWAEYQKHGVDRHGLAFGKKLFDLKAAAEVVQGGTSFSKSLGQAGIPHSTAYFWLEKYAISAGYKPLYKKGSPAQQVIIPFDKTREMALQIIRDGFKVRKTKEPEKDRLVQAAKDWAHARLSGGDVNPPLILVKGSVAVDAEKLKLVLDAVCKMASLCWKDSCENDGEDEADCCECKWCLTHPVMDTVLELKAELEMVKQM